MRRKDREMTKEFALQVCDKCNFATVAMVDTSGLPYCVAINVVLQGEEIYFHTAKAGFKIDCLKENPNVCISLVGDNELIPERFTTEYESAVVRGIAKEVSNREEKISALRLLCQKFASSNMAGFDTAISESLNHTAIWKVGISEISGKSNMAKHKK
ncbi:MAG: pyridoxamine 5'-phosphate oxidase family protein [Bacillota bacterium]